MSTPPNTKQISENIVAQVEASVGQPVPFLPRSFTRVVAKALAAVVTTLYKYIGFIALQQFVQTATLREVTILGRTFSPLKMWGQLVGVPEPTSATAAELRVTLSTPSAAGPIDAGVLLIGTRNGVTYTNTTALYIINTTTDIVVRAVADPSGGDGRGVIGNLNPGDEITVANPVPFVEQVAIVSEQVVTAADAETEAAYRQRVTDGFTKRPQGGAPADYEAWAESVPGILNAYPYVDPDCPGQVRVYCEATPESSGSASGIPTEAQLQAALDAINYDENGLARRRPILDLVNTHPVARIALNVEVDGLTAQDFGATTEAIDAAVGEYLRGREPYIPGLTVPPRTDRVTRSGVSGVVADVAEAQGATFVTVNLKNGATAVEVVTLGIGQKAEAGDITYINS
jgi:uncharacterized phage protein gp47/JayE